MKVIADLQLHSKYSRAVSQQMIIPEIHSWAKRKGIGLVATGDWTHPLWMREIKANLEETGNGLLRLKSSAEVGPLGRSDLQGNEPLFLLATEVSCIYSQGGKLRRIHTLIWVPTIVAADAINKAFLARGANLMSDGRPIVGLTSIQIAEIVLTIEPEALVIPAHAWTPWFSLYGSESGFDSIDECFGQFSKYIYAIETGLSSDPAMNWRIKELDNRSILSFSDAHSGPKLGREATVFELTELSFAAVREAIMGSTKSTTSTTGSTSTTSSQIKNSRGTRDTSDTRGTSRIAYTLEFYPEEGKYHYTGHRNCGIKQTPVETKKKGNICPVCGRRLTVGVMHRVEQLAGRSEDDLKIRKRDIEGLEGEEGLEVQGVYSDMFPNRPPFVKLVPLLEILAEAIGASTISQSIKNEYFKCTDLLGSEFQILLQKPLSDIAKISSEKVAQSIDKVRHGDIVIDPGYDGVFGVVKIWGEEKQKDQEEKKDQLSLF